jgi:ribosomal protein L29
MQSESVEILELQLIALQTRQLRELMKKVDENKKELRTLRGKRMKLKNNPQKPNINPICILFPAIAARNLQAATSHGLPPTMTDEEVRFVLKQENKELMKKVDENEKELCTLRGKRMKLKNSPQNQILIQFVFYFQQ